MNGYDFDGFRDKQVIAFFSNGYRRTGTDTVLHILGKWKEGVKKEELVKMVAVKFSLSPGDPVAEKITNEALDTLTKQSSVVAAGDTYMLNPSITRKERFLR